MEEYTVITMFNKKDIEVDRETGAKVEQALKSGAKLIKLEDSMVNTSGIAMIEHKTRTKPMSVYEIFEMNPPKQITKEKVSDGSGYKKFKEAKAKLIEKMSLRKTEITLDREKPKPIKPFDYTTTSMPARIYKTRYRNKMAKVALEQAGMGIGYVLLDQGKDSNGSYVDVAFVYPAGEETADRVLVSAEEERWLTPIFDKRAGFKD